MIVADRGPGSIRHISPKTSPACSVPTILALAPRPMITSTEPLTMKNAVSPSSPSEMMVSPALNAMACMNLSASLDRSLPPPPGDDGGADLQGRHATRYTYLSRDTEVDCAPRLRHCI